MKYLYHIADVILSMLLIASLVFFLVNVIPADPVRAFLGPNVDDEAAQKLSREWGLNEPIGSRYLSFMLHVVQGRFGKSFYYQREAGDILLELAPSTLMRAGVALFVGGLLGFFLARLAVRYKMRGGRSLLVVLQAIPSFCIMVVILWLFARGLGSTPLSSPVLYQCLIVLGAALYPMGAVGTYVFETVSIDAGRSPQVDLLQNLHAPPKVVQRFLARSAVPGSILILLNSVIVVITSVSFAEIIFGVSGFGLVYFRSCERGDVPVVVAGAMLLSFLVLQVQKLGDIALHSVDRRISNA